MDRAAMQARVTSLKEQLGAGRVLRQHLDSTQAEIAELEQKLGQPDPPPPAEVVQMTKAEHKALLAQLADAEQRAHTEKARADAAEKRANTEHARAEAEKSHADEVEKMLAQATAPVPDPPKSAKKAKEE